MEHMTISFTSDQRAIQFYATLKALAFRGITNIYRDDRDVHYDYRFGASMKTYKAVACILAAMSDELGEVR